MSIYVLYCRGGGDGGCNCSYVYDIYFNDIIWREGLINQLQGMKKKKYNRSYLHI